MSSRVTLNAHIKALYKWPPQLTANYLTKSSRNARTKLKKAWRKLLRTRRYAGSSGSDNSSGYRGVQYTEVSNLIDVDHYRGGGLFHSRLSLHVVNGAPDQSSSDSSTKSDFEIKVDAAEPACSSFESDSSRDVHRASFSDRLPSAPDQEKSTSGGGVPTSDVVRVPALILDVGVDPERASSLSMISEAGRVAQRRRLRRTRNFYGSTQHVHWDDMPEE